MKIIVQSPHFVLSSELNEFVTHKVNSLAHLNNRIELANVLLKLDKSDHVENKVCEIRLSVPDHDLFAERKGKSFEEVIIETVDALQQQIAKLKTKTKEHHPS